MTHGIRRPIGFSRRRGRRVEADLTGGATTGNGGVMLVSGQDRRQASCRHGRLDLLRQRLHALCPGHSARRRQAAVR